jgi:septal ring factor EnvC (AmiA/AmiB activator)
MQGLWLLLGWSCVALTLRTEANPIRKVVTLLQDMQKEIEAEGVKEKGMFDQYMCYCDGNTDNMSKAVEEAGQKITELKSKLESSKAEKSQLDQELLQHKKDRETARGDLSTANAIREKEHAEFTESTGESKANLDAMTSALAALEKGMGKSFIQQNKKSVDRLARVISASSVTDYEKSEVLDLLQGKNPFGDYSAQSGEIVGILKAMKDEMDKDLGGAVSAEEAAAAGFEELASAKKAEISAASEAIESKSVRTGELAVLVTTTADDIEDTTGEMKETEAFVANLAATCAAKKKEWAQRQEMRAEEISAISEAIKVLNDDDALDLFKKTLSLTETADKMGFLQQKSSTSVVLKAKRVLKALRHGPHAAQIALIQYSLKSKSVDFSKILAQIDGMVKVLGEEQKGDDETKAFCDKELTKTEGEKTDTEEAIASSAALIDEMTDTSASLADEIAELQKEIKSLDKAVAEATEQRKEEHEDSIVFLQENNMAVQLIEKAKNKLFKFYRPNLHKEEETTPAPELLELSSDSAAAPPPPPDTWGAYQKKDGKSNGVIALMEMLGKELTDGITEAEHEEKTAQKDYERLMSESTASRSKMAESITSKEVAKADLDTKIEGTKEKKGSQETELSNIKQYLATLHADCDFLVDNYDLRKAARENEVEGLKNAKSVLSGADLS